MKNKKQKGVTLIEVLVAIFVVVTGVIGSLSLVTQVMQFTSLSSSKLIASYLAQEGVEIVRNIRDQNWLGAAGGACDDGCWNNGLNNGDWEADYSDSSLVSCPNIENCGLNLDSNGFYSKNSAGRFKRLINLTSDIDADGINIIKVKVTVSWDQVGNQRIEVQENLYNWR